jgi:o-succinylbenzoate synthase
MKIVEFYFKNFEIPFNFPLKIQDHVLQIKQGASLFLVDEKQNVTEAEISHLPPLHQLSLKEEKSLMANFLETIVDKEIALTDFTPQINLFNLFHFSLIEFNQVSPVGKMAIEMALKDLLSVRFPDLVNKFFPYITKDDPVISNKLLIPQHQVTSRSLGFLKTTNLIKFKVGRQSLKEDIQKINDLAIDHELRIDGNRLMRKDQFIELISNIPLGKIQYFEEPFTDFSDYQFFLEDYSLSFALDESFSLFKDKLHKINAALFPFVVLKPTLYGGYNESLKLIKELNQLKISVVISSTFEKELGLKCLSQLASYQNTFKETACGLNTLDFLKISD